MTVSRTGVSWSKQTWLATGWHNTQRHTGLSQTVGHVYRGHKRNTQQATNPAILAFRHTHAHTNQFPSSPWASILDHCTVSALRSRSRVTSARNKERKEGREVGREGGNKGRTREVERTKWKKGTRREEGRKKGTNKQMKELINEGTKEGKKWRKEGREERKEGRKEILNSLLHAFLLAQP